MKAAQPHDSLHPAARTLPSQREVETTNKRGKTPYLPTLLDRLCDDEPSQQNEAPEAYAPNRAQMRDILKRDLSNLLNTINAESWLDRDRYPEAAASTIN